MNICVIGTGYVGLVTGTCFAEMGNRVWCYDIDATKIKNLHSGMIPIYEPGLKEMILKNVKEERLFFTADFTEAIAEANFSFVAVGTPPGEGGSADLSHVLAVAEKIGEYMTKYQIIVNKSTVPVGTADKVKAVIGGQIRQRGLNIDFDVVSNPEFLKEGAAVEDFMRPDRIIIGADNVRAAEAMKRLYEPFVRNQHPIYVMDIKSAEITKYAANAMLAARISFMNEIARLCDRVGGDIANVRLGIGSDSRIGMPFLYAGAGYGGSCFPKDVKALIRMGGEFGLPMELVSAVESVNNYQKHYIIDLVLRRFGDDLRGLAFGLWGLAFKPQTDDMREAPSIVIIEQLIEHGAKIIAYDPEASEQAKRIFSGKRHQENLVYVENLMKAADDVDALILITEWRQFRQPDFEQLKRRMKTPVIFDGRNQYDPVKMKELGFLYYCIGRNGHEK
jgi:nucleotide sugar dehydrogenase